MTAANGANGNFLPPHSPEWFLRGSTPEVLTSDFVIRSLRRRLWKAFQDDSAETAFRAYQATTQDLERWLEDEEGERQSLLRHQELSDKEKRPYLNESKRKPLSRRCSTTGSTTTAPLPYEASFYHIKLENLQGPVLQSYMNPSEPFIADDYLSPYDLESYEYPARKELPNYDPLQPYLHNNNKERRPRLAMLQFFRKSTASPSVVAWDEDVNRRDAQIILEQNLGVAPDPSIAAATTTTTTQTSSTIDARHISADAPIMTTPLHEAARLGAGDFIRFFLAHGGDPNIKNGMTRTALHMASGGYTQEEQNLLQQKKKASAKKKRKKKLNPSPLGIAAPVIPTQIFDIMKDELKKSKKAKSSSAQKAVKAVGRFVKAALGAPKEKEAPPESLPSKRMKKMKFDSQKWKHLSTERMDAVLAVLAWCHSETGDGPSINAVDADGRTALHYAAELGRADICMAILSNFGAMLTIIDDVGARTPCELAGENGHKELAAQLEARALLYIDPYGVDDELVVNMLQMENNRIHNHPDERRGKLVTPFRWFETISLDQVGTERLERLKIARGKLLKVVQSRDMATTAMERLLESAAEFGMESALRGEKDSSLDGDFRQVLDGDNKNESNPLTDTNNVEATNPSTRTEQRLEEEEGNHAVNIELDGLPDRNPKMNLQLAFSSLQESHVERFLTHHRWNVAEAIKVFKSDPIDAFAKANIVLPSKVPSNVASIERICPICYDDDVDEEDWMIISGCSHGFCHDCLKGYLKDCASTKMAFSSITCPHHECETVLAMDEIDRILKDDVDAAVRIRDATYEQFVTTAHDFRFCNYPGCPGIIHRLPAPFLSKHGIDESLINFAGAVCTAISLTDTSDGRDHKCPLTYEGVEDWEYNNAWSTLQPRKAHRFCFACGETRHWPISCKMLEQWRQKVCEEIGTVEAESDKIDFSELAQKLWIKTNTRPCPKCEVPIEKDDGCNHMTCTNPACRYEFCWICRKDWKLHGAATGGFFRCNIWQEDQEVSGDTKPSATVDDLEDSFGEQGYGTAIHSAREAFRVRQEMARFVHHYTRFEAHGESLILEQKMADTVCTRLAPVVTAAAEFHESPEFNFGGKGLSFVHAAFTELLECRSVLKHSYAFSFFRYPSMYNFRRFAQLNSRRREKVTFERIQSELEMLTEQMSDIVARAHLRATQVQITFLTAHAAEKREDFSNLIFSILHEERKEAMFEEKVFAPTSSLTNQRFVLGRDDENSSDEEGDRFRSSLTSMLARNLPLDLEEIGAPPVAQMWECPACTYMNSSGRHCAMCGGLRSSRERPRM